EFLHTGHLIDYFFASRFNDREDEYSGDLAGRMRFPLRVIGAMRAEADGMALGVRLSVLERVADGRTADLAVAAVREYGGRRRGGRQRPRRARVGALAGRRRPDRGPRGRGAE